MNFLEALEEAKKGALIRPVTWQSEWNAVYLAKKIEMRLSKKEAKKMQWQIFIVYDPSLIGTKKDHSENSRISCTTNIEELTGEWEIVSAT